jgi:hypothetical protein
MIEEANHAPMNTAAHRFRIGQAELPPVDRSNSEPRVPGRQNQRE